MADLAWQARARRAARSPPAPAGRERALRELLALQSSDWAFLTTRGLAGDYPRERAAGHLAALEQTLGGAAAHEQSVRSLAPDLFGWEG